MCILFLDTSMRLNYQLKLHYHLSNPHLIYYQLKCMKYHQLNKKIQLIILHHHLQLFDLAFRLDHVIAHEGEHRLLVFIAESLEQRTM